MTMTDEVKLKRCPCGETPTRLFLYDIGQGRKWVMTYGDCCGEWHVEFRNGSYFPLDHVECLNLAIAAWNNAPRG